MLIAGMPDYITRVHFIQEGDAIPPASPEPPPILLLCVEQLIQYFNGDRRLFELPIHQPGTSFQQETWNLLTNIAFAKTISYMQLAIQTGDPKATRAVANANGKNDVAVIIPCHRVIGSNRELTGYAGGLWRKKWLLEHENKVAYGVQTLF